ncbi:hypothetical protein DRE_06083 [Drechslerella stenobrocha 248]|uniref:Glutamine amidotransferase type-2 domain-containing protein n=1 Tax=Drechslerella stenobrocha 248 TaxID=1043628 RepID=W7I863_9PEZI|nr:hypothetical protein DRE_06083 [Drechslerella stenobrocha 248]
MCGILFQFAHAGNDSNPSSDNLVRDVARRGPDSLQTVEITADSCRLSFTASVLSLRGASVVPQPLSSPSTSRAHQTAEYVLCWNGEAWRFDGREFAPDENDAELIFQELSSCQGRVQDVLNRIEGPFAFVFYDGPNNRLWFGRDWLGRRSLLIRKPVPGTSSFAICSIADPDDLPQWGEVEADGFYYMDLSAISQSQPGTDIQLQSIQKVAFISETHESAALPSSCMKLPIPQLCKTIPKDVPPALTPDSLPVSRLYNLLRDSVRLRVQNIPLHSIPSVPGHDGILRPSKVGILFSGGLDCSMLAKIAHDILPTNEPIELLNVAFERRRLPTKAPRHKKKVILNTSEEPTGGPGGEPIFHPDDDIYAACPDRQTGRRSWRELQTVCPDRDWRFREINVPYEEVVAHRHKVVALLYPHDTEMDLSIGLAFYFASQPLELDSPKILLSGLGADELFAGYARHGTAFNRGGLRALVDELDLDLARLGKRNLGRDDRIIVNWGREARFPFLDERLLREVVTWPVTDKCGFGSASSATEAWDGLDNEKKALRLLAWKLGMRNVAGEKKRAVRYARRPI